MTSITPSLDGDDYDYEFEDGQNGQSGKKRKSAAGRKLMRWNPDADQLVLLMVEHICTKKGIPVPWDDVAKAIEPRMTGEAIKQHLSKVHKYRAQAGRMVPPKLEKTDRVKSKKANGVANTPGKGARGGVKTEGGGEGGEFETPTKGASLLWHDTTKLNKPPKTAKTPATGTGTGTGRGRKKGKAEHGGDENSVQNAFETPTKSTGKRGRTTKKNMKVEEVNDFDNVSPNKKQRIDEGIQLRPLKRQVNYNVDDQLDPDDEEDIYDAKQAGDDDFEEVDEFVTVKQEATSSQDSGIYGLPPPQFGAGTSRSQTHHAYAPPALQDFSNSDGINPLNNPYGMQFYGGETGLPSHPHTPIQHPNPLSDNYAGQAGTFGGFQNGFHNFMDNDGFGMALPPGFADRIAGHASPSSFGTVQGEIGGEDMVPVQDQKSNISRKKQSPEDKKTNVKGCTQEKKGTKKKANQDMMQAVNQPMPQKTDDSGIEGVDTEEFHGSGIIYSNNSIMDATHAGNTHTHHYDFANNTSNLELAINTSFPPSYNMPLTVSRDDFDPDTNVFIGATNGAMVPHQDNFGFNNNQFTHGPSHDSSFDSAFNSGYGSIHGSQTDEAMPSFTMGGHNFNNHGNFESIAYEQPMPGDEAVDDDGFFDPFGHQHFDSNV